MFNRGMSALNVTDQGLALFVKRWESYVCLDPPSITQLMFTPWCIEWTVFPGRTLSKIQCEIPTVDGGKDENRDQF